ncbi:methyltransferase domain-containing protein [Streptomyces sp. NPDC049881]|uniref:methyltransferase domain-containing protein n=1 Tax=Streptomyces sp. NPDC049881 TaxID=3155778 RepID=UPI0034337075
MPLPFPVPPGWERAFAELPRSRFLPDVIWPHDLATDTFTVADRAADPRAWRRAAEADVPVVTQWDDGRHTGPGPGRDATSSASRPSLVAAMLEALEVTPGMRVLEIGTGTGWNAALLAHRLGERNVTTVEIDPRVAADAAKALARAGLRPDLVVGDGAEGAPDAAPFDRIIATAGLSRVPPAWTRQVRPGGLILTPWGTPYSRWEGLARLTVGPDGSASGPFVDLVAFMKLRAQRRAVPRYPEGLPFTDSMGGVWPPHELWHPFRFLAGLRLPDVTHAVQAHGDGHTQWLYSLTDASWTAAVRRGVGPVEIRQAGTRRLWDELLDAYAWWTTAGEPGIHDFGLTITPDGTHTPWLDTPATPVRP